MERNNSPKIAPNFGSYSRRIEGCILIVCAPQCNAEYGPKDKQDGGIISFHVPYTGLTIVDYGIAKTATLVQDSGSEDVRIATMLSEIHVAVLPVSRIKPDAMVLENELKNMMKPPSGYVAFISGASHTADIERVLTIGVHGPQEFHILILNEKMRLFHASKISLISLNPRRKLQESTFMQPGQPPRPMKSLHPSPRPITSEKSSRENP